jgi:nucleoside-diphosphate-sugar epimerase
MDILITGGSGFIGANLALNILGLGHRVTIFDSQLNYSRLGREHANMTLLQGDVLNYKELVEIFRKRGIEIVVHLPALRNRESQEKPFQAHFVNSTGMINVLEAARLTSVKRVVYASSVAVYCSPAYYRSLNLDPFCIKEWMPTNPFNVYGATKLYDELMAARYMEIYGLKTIGLRLGIVIGPGKKPGSRTSEFNDIIEAAVLKTKVSISSYGEQKVNLIYVSDAVHGFVCACTADDPRHPVYNIGGYILSARELVAAVQSVFPETPITIEESQKERQTASAIDSSLAKEELGYEPQLSLSEAIKNHCQIISKGL